MRFKQNTIVIFPIVTLKNVCHVGHIDWKPYKKIFYRKDSLRNVENIRTVDKCFPQFSIQIMKPFSGVLGST